MGTDLTPEMLPGLLAHGLAMVEERSRRSGGAGIHDSIKAQLLYMQRTVTARETPDDETLARLTLGIYAAREFETSDPDFADVLFKAEYLFRRL